LKQDIETASTRFETVTTTQTDIDENRQQV
jgi:hypothetical protein